MKNWPGRMQDSESTIIYKPINKVYLHVVILNYKICKYF